jgi:hypothetical protein
MSALQQIAFKQSDDISREVEDVLQAWDNKLEFPPSEVPKHYLRGNLCILIELLAKFGGESRRFLAHAASEFSSEGGVRQINAANVVDDDQRTVLVNPVQIIDNPEGMSAGPESVVRLKFFDDLQSSRTANSLYFSLITGEFVFRKWLHFENRKFDVFAIRRIPIAVTGQCPSDVIEARSTLVDDLSCQHAKARRDDQLLMVADSLRMSLVIYLWNHGVFALLKEPRDFPLQILDTLIGPF